MNRSPLVLAAVCLGFWSSSLPAAKSSAAEKQVNATFSDYRNALDCSDGRGVYDFFTREFLADQLDTLTQPEPDVVVHNARIIERRFRFGERINVVYSSSVKCTAKESCDLRIEYATSEGSGSEESSIRFVKVEGQWLMHRINHYLDFERPPETRTPLYLHLPKSPPSCVREAR